VGRTGRKRAGRVEVLLSESREEANWDKAKEHYETVQASIMRGETLELFADVDRLLPDHIKPKCLETNMVIEEYVRDTKPSKSNVSAPTGTKRKRNTDVTRNIPDGAVNGFVPSSKLIPKRDSKKRKVATVECTWDEVEDDDQTVESDIRGSPRGKPGPKGKPKPKPTTTTTPRKKKGSVKDRGRKSSAFNEMSLSQLDRELADDTDDMELELGINWSSPGRPLADAGSSTKPPFHSQSSPISIRSSPELTATKADDGLALDSLPSKRAQSVGDHSWLLDSDDDIKVIEDLDSSVNLCHNSSKLGNTGHTSFQWLSSFRRSPLSHVPSERLRTQNSMLPPPVSENALTSSSFPQSTFAIRQPGVRRKRPQLSSSPSVGPRSEKDQLSSPASSPPRPSIRSKKPKRIDSRALGLLDLEAQVSGDETMGGSSDHEDVESESDRR
jgi:ATP-dependent DNA helicase MPH1